MKFIKTVQQAGMHMILRIGPFVAAEWNFGYCSFWRIFSISLVCSCVIKLLLVNRGVPVWLHYVPETVFRQDNEPWKVSNHKYEEKKNQFSFLLENSYALCEFLFQHYMESFTTYIVNLLKKEKLFAPQGGPIILSQVKTYDKTLLNFSIILL